MSALPLLLRPLILLAALPAGLVLCRALPRPQSFVARAGTATLAGVALLTGIVHALVCLGLPGRTAWPIVVSVSMVAALGAWFTRGRRAPPAEPAPARRRSAALALFCECAPVALIAALLAGPAMLAERLGITEHDAIYIWTPKTVRALDEAPPDLAEDTPHHHPEYPRGLPLIVAAVAAPFGDLDARLPRVVSLALFALTLLAVFDALACRRNAIGGALAVLVLGALPLLIHHAVGGLADVPLAGFILLCVVGLTPSDDGRRATGLALAGALGALVTKDEGAVVFATAIGILLVAAIRRREGRGLTPVLIALALAMPWVMLRSGVEARPLLVGAVPQNAGMLFLLRPALVLREIGHFVLGLPDPSPDGFSLGWSPHGNDITLLMAALCTFVLLVGRRRKAAFVLLPLGVLALADFCVFVLTPLPVDWQIVTACDRLILQLTPVLVLAAIHRLTAPAAVTSS